MMQKELQFTLSIIGILIIGGVLLHGMWTIRKNAKKQKKSRFESRKWEPGFDKQNSNDDEDEPYYEDVAVSKARVVSKPQQKQDEADISSDEHDLAESFENLGVKPQAQNYTNKDNHHTPEQAVDSGDRGNEVESQALYTQQSRDLPMSNNQGEQSQGLDAAAFYDKASSQEDSRNTGAQSVKATDFGPTDDIERDETSESLSANEAETHHYSDREKAKSKVQTNENEGAKASEAPIYSNVVTQPKPEFVRSTISATDDSFGQPPGFLLKKNQETEKTDESLDLESKLELEQINAKYTVSDNTEQKDVLTEIAKPAEATKSAETAKPTVEQNQPSYGQQSSRSDFSLDMQESPVVEVTKERESKTPDVSKELSFAEQAKRFVRRNRKTVAEKIRKEPSLSEKLAEEQMRMDFNESQSQTTSTPVQSKEEQSSKVDEKPAPRPAASETDVLVLNVRASDDNPINGASLLPMLLTLGFKFGDHDIFHRHVSTNGKGPILFSLTNMFKPGVFDIDNIENFNTYGLSLFMMLPIDADPQQVFNMMHNAARKISEEFGCRILDSNKVGLSKQSLQQYVERIREFERRRRSK
jgi:cell division protein ZipA